MDSVMQQEVVEVLLEDFARQRLTRRWQLSAPGPPWSSGDRRM